MLEKVWKKGNPLALLWDCKLIENTMENNMEIPLKTRDKATIPEETIIEKDTCTPVCIAALFTIARTWKQPRRPSTDERIKKLLYIYRMEYLFSHKKDHI